MSDGIDETNSKLIHNHEDLRFQDAAQTIFSKYQIMGMIKPFDEAAAATTTTASSSAHMARHRQETIVSSRACTIL